MRDALLILLFALLLGQAIVATRPGYLDLLVEERGLAHVALQVVGAALMLCGIGFFAVAQLHLGASWRIGIDADAKPGLVTDGLYRYSRNPDNPQWHQAFSVDGGETWETNWIASFTRVSD